MASVERLLQAYERFAALPWIERIAAQQRVWMLVYEPREERRLRFRIAAFEEATLRAGHGWLSCDLTDEFARWMSGQEYRESYFESPEDLSEDLLDDFAERLAETVRAKLLEPGADGSSVVAVYGIGALFGLARVSRLLDLVAPQVKGRLLLFFPGERDGASYRLLDARDGWNYLAVPITAQEGGKL